MIRTSIKKQRGRLECNFHHHDFEFYDFHSFFTYCVQRAFSMSIFEIQIIHGKGRDDAGMEFLGDTIRQRLANREEIASIRYDGTNSGITVVHLNKNYQELKNMENPFKGLRKLHKELSREEEYQNTVVSKTEQKKKYDQIEDQLEELLQADWDEVGVRKLIEQYMEQRDDRTVSKILSFVKTYEVFYSQDFHSYLEEVNTWLFKNYQG